MSDLDNFTERQLKEALERKVEERLKAEREERDRRANVVFQNVDAFLQLADKHTCGGSDHSLKQRGTYGCLRCVLLYAKQNDGFYDDVEISFYIGEVIHPEERRH